MKNLFLAICLFATCPLLAQDNQGYQRPPDAIAKLVVEAFAANLGRKQHVNGSRVFFGTAEAIAQIPSLVLGDVAVNKADTDRLARKLLDQIGERVPKCAEDEELVVIELLLVTNDFEKGGNFWVCAG